MIKRILLVLALALCAMGVSFADVKIKDLDGTNVEITFTFRNDAATKMGVIGSFNNWTEPGLAMTKNADGLWEYTLKALKDDEIVYKFFYEGQYIFDERAPDKKDDGFGGSNGLIVVADILSGAVGGAGAGTAAGPVTPTYPSKINFGMYTLLGSKSTFSTQGLVDKTVKGFETDSTGISVSSYWKAAGTMLPNVNVFAEMAVANGYKAIWEQDSRGIKTTESDDGIANTIAGLLTNPIGYLNGGNPSLNSAKMGIDTPFFSWETGYAYAKASKRSAILWETISGNDANDGYMRFDLGPKLKQVGPVTIEAAVAPTKQLSNMGLYSWIGATWSGLKFDFQYDVKSAESADVSKFFNKLYHQDFLLGFKTKVEGVDIQAQSLINVYSEETFDPAKHIAGEVKLGYSLPKELLGLTLGYRYTGAGSDILFGSDDNVGAKDTQRALLNVSSRPIEVLRVGLDSTAVITGMDLNSTEFYAKPYAEFTLDDLIGEKSNVSLYAKGNVSLDAAKEYDGSGEQFILGEAGAKFYMANVVPGVINGMDVFLGYNNWDEFKTFSTLIASAKMPNDISAELGLGLRLTKDTASAALENANNMIGFSVGGSYKVPVRDIKTPLLYGAFVYNMDPYGSDNNLELSDFTTKGGSSKSDGKAQLRVMFKWDF